MVSKITKRTPLKSIRDCWNHQRRPRRKLPEKNAPSASPSTVASSAIIKSINRSVFACKRRLLKIFSKLACVGTPNRQQQLKISTPPENHDEVEPLIRRPLVFDHPLPPLLSPKKRTVFLDLDETLIHSMADPPPERFDFIVRPLIDGEVLNFYVLKRPGVNELLRALGQKFEVVVFTAAVKEYASLVIDKLDPRGFISHRLYRDSCKEIAGKFVKDLSDIGRDLRKAVIVDDNPNSFLLQPENAIPIRPFTGEMNDRELEKLMKFFEVCDSYEDMRDAVKNYVSRESEVEPLIRIEHPLPPLLSPKKRTVFLDLDKTLIYSMKDPPPERFDFIVRLLTDGEVENFYVLKRPGVNKLLGALGQKFEVVVFTSALKEYASPIIDKLDPRGLISHRLYRDSCKKIDGKLVKDLSDIGRDLRKAVIVDDKPDFFSLQPENAIPIRPFRGDMNDRELEKLMKFFEVCDSYEDMRDAVKNYVFT